MAGYPSASGVVVPPSPRSKKRGWLVPLTLNRVFRRPLRGSATGSLPAPLKVRGAASGVARFVLSCWPLCRVVCCVRFLLLAVVRSRFGFWLVSWSWFGWWSSGVCSSFRLVAAVSPRVVRLRRCWSVGCPCPRVVLAPFLWLRVRVAARRRGCFVGGLGRPVSRGGLSPFFCDISSQ